MNRLAAAGLPRVEAASFVRAERVPQMAGAEEVVAAIERRDGTEYSGLVLNAKGYERFAASGLDRVNVTLGATESFNQRNGEMSRDEALAQVEAILAAATEPATVTISRRVRLPLRGRGGRGRGGRARGAVRARTRSSWPTRSASRLRRRCGASSSACAGSASATGFHGHNTRNTGYANALAALEAGAEVLDSSIGGLGGCPYAPRASGNVATEDLVYLLEREGIPTGVDLEALIAISTWLEGIFGRKLEGQVYRAGAWPA